MSAIEEASGKVFEDMQNMWAKNNEPMEESDPSWFTDNDPFEQEENKRKEELANYHKEIMKALKEYQNSPSFHEVMKLMIGFDSGILGVVCSKLAENPAQTNLEFDLWAQIFVGIQQGQVTTQKHFDDCLNQMAQLLKDYKGKEAKKEISKKVATNKPEVKKEDDKIKNNNCSVRNKSNEQTSKKKKRTESVKFSDVTKKHEDTPSKSNKIVIIFTVVALFIAVFGILWFSSSNSDSLENSDKSSISSIIDDLEKLNDDIIVNSHTWEEDEWNKATELLINDIAKLPNPLEYDERISVSIVLSSILGEAQMYENKASKMLEFLASQKDLINDDNDNGIQEIGNQEVASEEGKDNNVTDALAIDKIKEFYNNFVFGSKEATDDIINMYCTKKLAKKLTDDYEYEGNGYALWEFRSGKQDGDSDIQTIENVEALGEGKYKVWYNDMGTKGTCVISVSIRTEGLKYVDSEDILFDEIMNSVE